MDQCNQELLAHRDQYITQVGISRSLLALLGTVPRQWVGWIELTASQDAVLSCVEFSLLRARQPVMGRWQEFRGSPGHESLDIKARDSYQG
jgi:hypothetical protein